LGATLYDLHNQADAIKELRDAARLDPKNAGAHRFLGHAYSQQNDPHAAESELRSALALKPTSEIYFEYALVEEQLGKVDSAISALRHAIRLNPRFEPAHLLLGVMLRRAGHHAEALAQFRKSVELNPSDPEAQFNLGMELKSGADLTGAVAAFRKAIELKPDLEKAHYNLGIALRAQRQMGAAEKELRELKGLHDFRRRLAQAKLLTLQGVDALKQQKFDDALSLFQQAIEQAPELPTGHYYLGVTLQRKNETALAQAAFQKALELKPDYAQAHTNLGLLYWSQNDRTRALDEFRQAVMSDPDSSESHYNLGLALAQSAKLDEAVREFSEAVSLNPEYTDARIQLGLVLSQKGRHNGRRQHLSGSYPTGAQIGGSSQQSGLSSVTGSKSTRRPGRVRRGCTSQTELCQSALQPWVGTSSGRKGERISSGVR
jgi:tetratricopeptide (TPR) repeat protein